MKITKISEIEFLSRFELIEGSYRYDNETFSRKNELYIVDNGETALTNTKLVHKVIERILTSLPNNTTYQIDIDSTIEANDDIHIQNNDNRYGMEVICFDAFDKNNQKIMFGETPEKLLDLIAYMVDSLGYKVYKQNDYVNILGYINTLLKLKQYFNSTEELQIYFVTPQTNDYLEVLNIPATETKIPVYLSLFAKCVKDDGSFDTSTFSEAIGLNIFDDKTILQTLTKFNN